MEYQGKLYGKVAGKYVPLAQTAAGVDALRARAEKAEAARDFLLARISEVKRDLEIGDREDSNWEHVRAAILKCGLHDVDARKALAGTGV